MTNKKIKINIITKGMTSIHLDSFLLNYFEIIIK